jgi:hypothetical protein
MSEADGILDEALILAAMTRDHRLSIVHNRVQG